MCGGGEGCLDTGALAQGGEEVAGSRALAVPRRRPGSNRVKLLLEHPQYPKSSETKALPSGRGKQAEGETTLRGLPSSPVVKTPYFPL